MEKEEEEEQEELDWSWTLSWTGTGPDTAVPGQDGLFKRNVFMDSQMVEIFIITVHNLVHMSQV